MQNVSAQLDFPSSWTARDEELFITHLFKNHGKKVEKSKDNITDGIKGLSAWIENAPTRIWNKDNETKNAAMKSAVSELVPLASKYLAALKSM